MSAHRIDTQNNQSIFKLVNAYLIWERLLSILMIHSVWALL